MQTTPTTLGQRELDLLSPYFTNPHLRGLIISKADKVLFQRVTSEFPISHYTRESQRIDFPSGGSLYIAPFWADPSMFLGLDFNIVAIEGPYPDHQLHELLHRVRAHEGENIPLALYYAGELRIAS